MLGKALNIAICAGKILEKHWNRKLCIDTKQDGSLVTNADLEVNDFLTKSLEKDYSIPVVSEESIPDWEKRKNYRDFWLIDPLDGTKEFTERLADFCICLAYIRHRRPILSIVYAPALDEMYIAVRGKGVSLYQNKKRTTLSPPRSTKLVVAKSRFHNEEKIDQFCVDNKISASVTVGAAIKFGRIANGTITVYPRFHGPKEWDIAAGDLIVHESGGKMISLKTNEKILYNNQDMKADPFLALGYGVRNTLFPTILS